MTLRPKIFLAFFGIIFVFLSFILYVTNTRTTEFERERIGKELRSAQAHFLETFESERASALRLVLGITSDQKYRSFLQQMRDNYVPFAEEILSDTGWDVVGIFDENTAPRGMVARPKVLPKTLQALENLGTKDRPTALAKHLEATLDDGNFRQGVIAQDGSLQSNILVPLKESLRDSYARGVVVVGREIDDAWVQSLLASPDSDIAVLFYLDGVAVASNLARETRPPILKTALAADPGPGSFVFNGERFIALRGLFEESESEAGYVFAASLDKAMVPFVALQKQILLVGAGTLVLGIALVLFITGRIVSPIHRLVEGTRAVLSGDYDFRIEPRSRDEIGTLSSAFNEMVGGLKENEKIRTLFGKYVHPSIVSDIITHPENLERAGTRKVQTLLFSDIANFTTLSEGMAAEKLVEFLNRYLSAMSDEIAAAEGILDKYLGDGIMSFWGPPFTKGNHALGACSAALAMQAKLSPLQDEWRADGFPPVAMRVGLATGEVIVGNIGSERSQDYTCIGDTVNLASRLEGVNKFYDTGIVIDAATREMAGDSVVVRALDTIQVKGRTGATEIYELAGLKGTVPEARLALLRRSEEALRLYRSARFAEALAIWEGIGADDPPSRIMAGQCRQLLADPPAAWTGVRQLEQK